MGKFIVRKGNVFTVKKADGSKAFKKELSDTFDSIFSRVDAQIKASKVKRPVNRSVKRPVKRKK